MENFFYDDTFYRDLDDFMESLDLDEESIKELDDNIVYNCYYSKLQPVIVFDIEWIIDLIDDERLPEEGRELDKIRELIESNCNFEAINKGMPMLYYEDRRNKFTITKQDLLKHIE